MFMTFQWHYFWFRQLRSITYGAEKRRDGSPWKWPKELPVHTRSQPLRMLQYQDAGTCKKLQNNTNTHFTPTCILPRIHCSFSIVRYHIFIRCKSKTYLWHNSKNVYQSFQKCKPQDYLVWGSTSTNECYVLSTHICNVTLPSTRSKRSGKFWSQRCRGHPAADDILPSSLPHAIQTYQGLHM